MTGQSTNGVEMEGLQKREYFQGEEEIDLAEYLSMLWPYRWRIAGISLAIGIVTLLLMFLKPNVYQATAVIAPEVDQKRPNLALGALASFGVDLGGTTAGLLDMEMLFNSKDLTVRVFRKYNLIPILFPDMIDPITGKKKSSLMDDLLGGKESRVPSDWDAIRAARGLLTVNSDRKNGLIKISFESRSPVESANVVKYYLEEGKSRLQEEALDRASKNKKFIETQIGKTVDALTKDRLYSLYGQEVEREMMARNREQFGFRVVDPPRVPDRKLRPRRGLTALGVTLFAGFALSVYFLVRDRRKISMAKKECGKREDSSTTNG